MHELRDENGWKNVLLHLFLLFFFWGGMRVGPRNIVTVFSQEILYVSCPAKNFAIRLKKYQHSVKSSAVLQSC